MAQAKPREIKKLEQDLLPLEERKDRARVWFEALRDSICSAIEAVEDVAEGLPLYKGQPAGRTRLPNSSL